jgi:hypothetical protein
MLTTTRNLVPVLACFVLAACGSREIVESELIGTWSEGKSSLVLRADRTFVAADWPRVSVPEDIVDGEGHWGFSNFKRPTLTLAFTHLSGRSVRGVDISFDVTRSGASLEMWTGIDVPFGLVRK